MAWNLAGIAASLVLAAFAYIRSRVPGSFYDREVYGMTRSTHLRYAWTALALAMLFAAAWVLKLQAEIALFAAFVLLAIFYLTSFLRGAHEDDG